MGSSDSILDLVKCGFAYLVCPCAGMFCGCYYAYLIVRQKYGDGRPIGGFCGTGNAAAHRNWENQKKINEKLKEERVKPLSRLRKRSLTIRNDGTRSRLWQRRPVTRDQLQSPFFGRFPLEIREMIYFHYLVASKQFYIYRRADRRLGHHGRNDEYQRYCPPGLSWGFDNTITGAWDLAGNGRRERDDLISLLMTCRRAYGRPTNRVEGPKFADHLPDIPRPSTFCIPRASSISRTGKQSGTSSRLSWPSG